MDVLAHTLWTNAVFHGKYHKNKRQRYTAAFFGVLPDLISFVPLTVYFLFHGISLRPAAYHTTTHWTLTWAAQSYNFTHSLVMFGLLFLLVTMWRHGRAYWPLLGWGFHILLDIPTHKEFYPTPFLFPLSDFHNPIAVSWGTPWFMVLNYSVMAITYAGIFWYSKKRRRHA